MKLSLIIIVLSSILGTSNGQYANIPDASNPPDVDCPTCDNHFTFFGYGHCAFSAGSYKEWNTVEKDETMTVQKCADTCHSEPYCSLFSVVEGKYCFRNTNTPGFYGSVVGRCRNFQANSSYKTYMSNDQNFDIIDNKYTYKGRGRCNTGYYKGWSDDHGGVFESVGGTRPFPYMTVEACAQICDSEPACNYFSCSEGQVCERFTNIKWLASSHIPVGECIVDNPGSINWLYEKNDAIRMCFGDLAYWAGDPHIETFNGLKYDCQGAGEFVMLNTLENDFAIHSRFEGSGITLTRGVAFHIANDEIVSLEISSEKGLATCDITMRINGYETEMTEDAIPNSKVYFQPSIHITYIYMSNGAGLMIHVSNSENMGCVMHVEVCIPDELSGSFVGLAGTPSGNDWMTSGGTRVAPPQGNNLLFGPAYEYCVENWLVTNSEDSLFTYKEGERSFDDYNVADNEPFNSTIQDLYEAALGDPELADIRNNCNNDPACIIETLAGSEEDARNLQQAKTTLDDVYYKPTEILDLPRTEPEPVVYYDNGNGGGGGNGNGFGAYGDPHIKTWNAEKYDFHGICDLILLSNPEFENGLGMDIHIRSKIIKMWSYISVAAVRIGKDILEIIGGAKEKRFWINGIQNDEPIADNEMALESPLSGYPIMFKKTKNERREFSIALGDKEMIHFQTWNAFVSVGIKNASFDHFGHSVGLMGSFGYGKKLARDKKTIIDDNNTFGQEWQVLTSEPKFFHNSEGPQQPNKCDIPSSSEMRRRLKENTISIADAKKACADVATDDVEACVFDVVVTSDTFTARAY